MSAADIEVAIDASQAAQHSSPAETGPAEQAIDVVRETLVAHPLFKNSNADLPSAVADLAERRKLAPGQSLELHDDAPMFVVEHGALWASAGAGPAQILGPGTVLNVVGMLALSREAEPFRPGREPPASDAKGCGPRAEPGGAVNKASPYESCQHGRAPPMVFQDKRKWAAAAGSAPDSQGERVSDEDARCFYSVCPSGALRAPRQSARKLPGWLPLAVSGAPPGAVPTSGGDPPEFAGGGAVLAAVPLTLIKEVGLAIGMQGAPAASLRQSLAAFDKQCAEVADIWRIMMSRCSTIFHGVPAEIMWGISEVSEWCRIEPGEVFVAEGEGGDAGESLIFIEEGTAVVEKMVRDGGRREFRHVVVGRLHPGSIIGDMGLIGSGMPRAATVRAETLTFAVVMPGRGLLAVLWRYPGVVACVEHRLKEVGVFLQAQLPTRTEVFTTSPPFATYNYAFCSFLASRSDRLQLYAGQIVTEPATESGKLYVIEYGVCGVDDGARGRIAELSVGGCCGDPMGLGFPSTAGKTVRVVTPIAVVLVASRHLLQEALKMYSGKRRHGDAEAALPGGFNLSRFSAYSDVFGECGLEFVQEMCGAARMRAYMPGQTLCLEGAQDSAQMFMVRSGQVVAEKDAKRLELQNDHVVFGELSMLGVEPRRPATMRARTLCFTFEFPHEAFRAAIARYPREAAVFEQYAIKTLRKNPIEMVTWPFLSGAPTNFLYVLNMSAAQLEGTRPSSVLVGSSAILVKQGSAVLTDGKGEEVQRLDHGDCFNEQVLLGHKNSGHCLHKVAMNRGCELQILQKATWDQLFDKFPEQREYATRQVEKHVVDRAARGHGCSYGSVGVLRMSRLLELMSDDFAVALSGRLEHCIVAPEKHIVTAGQHGKKMHFLLAGVAEIEVEGRCVEFKAGKVFNETVLLGNYTVYANTIKAVSLSVLHCLDKRDFADVLKKHDSDRDAIGSFLKEAHDYCDQPLVVRLKSAAVFREASLEFLTALAAHAEDKFYVPGEVILRHGEVCQYGTSPMYLLLAGSLEIENKHGIRQATIMSGEVFGEQAALGLQPVRMATVRASRMECVHCARICASSIEAAFWQCPYEFAPLEELLEKRTKMTMGLSAKRNEWLQTTALPALERRSFFAGFSTELLVAVVAALLPETYTRGDAIVTAGAAADSMVILLEGVADVEANSGRKLGRLTGGAAFGEVAAMGLFATRPTTVRAVQKCLVLFISASAINHALASTDAESSRAVFSQHIACRQQQVACGLPMRALPVGMGREDTCARAIALQAERIDLKADEVLELLPECDPCGLHFSILAHGKACFELAELCEMSRARAAVSRAAAAVVSLAPGTLVLEGLASEYGLQLRAASACEVYRVRETDFLTCISSVPERSLREWLPRFRMLENESRSRLRQRGDVVLGMIDCLAPHPSDTDIHLWGTRRQRAIGLTQTKSLTEVTNRAQVPHAAPSKSQGSSAALRRRHPTQPLGSTMPARSAKHVASTPELSTTLPPCSTNLSRTESCRVKNTQDSLQSVLEPALHLPRLHKPARLRSQHGA